MDTLFWQKALLFCRDAHSELGNDWRETLIAVVESIDITPLTDEEFEAGYGHFLKTIHHAPERAGP